MALCSFCLLPPVTFPRRYALINPTRFHFFTSAKVSVLASEDRRGSATRISHVRASADTSTEEKSPSSSRIFVKESLMALSSFCLLSPVTFPRRYALINPSRFHFFTSAKVSVLASEDRRGSATRVSHVRASADTSTEEKSPSSSRIFVKGLTRSTSEGHLLKQFSQFGEISQVKIITSRGSKESLGMAYIVFSCKESAELAIKEMNGKFFDGRFIAVMISLPEAPTRHVKFVPYRF